METLTKEEKFVVFECLCTVEKGGIFLNSEFETLFGFPKSQLTALRRAWPDIVLNAPSAALIIIGALTNLLSLSLNKEFLIPM